LRSGRLNYVRVAGLACFGKDDWIPDVQTCIYLPNLAGRGDCLLYDLFDRGRSRCFGGAALDVGRRRSSLSPKLFVCRPVAKFCRPRSYCAGLAAANLAAFCRQSTVPSTHWPKCWRTSISLSYGTRYDRHGTLSYMTLLRHRFNSTRFTYRSFMCQLYERRYVDTSNFVVCGAPSSLATNSDDAVNRPMWHLLPNIYSGLDRNIMPPYGFWQFWCYTL
jgi:hypothetical protein